MEAFLQPLQGLAEFEEIKKRCGANRGILNVSGCMESQKVHLMYGLSGLFPCHLILADDERNAKEIYEDYRFYDKNVYFYPAKDLLFFQADIHGNLLIRQRMRVIRALLEQEEVTQNAQTKWLWRANIYMRSCRTVISEITRLKYLWIMRRMAYIYGRKTPGWQSCRRKSF